MIMKIDFSNLPDDELIYVYSGALKALRARKIIRTKNVVGELGERYAETIFSEISDLPSIKLSATNEKDIDAKDENGKGYNIKTVTESSAKRTSAMHFQKDHKKETKLFDWLLVVILNDSMELKNIYMFSWEAFWEIKSWSNTQKAWYLSLTLNNLSRGNKVI